MRIIPVMDLMNGQTVHAVKGDRAQYKPVQSILCDSADPVAVARAFRDTLGASELYVADLDAIQNSGRTPHREILASLAENENLHILLDAGVSHISDIRSWLDCGIHKIIVASETIRTWESVLELPKQLNPERIVFSLDSRDGVILSQSSTLAAIPPSEILQQIYAAGWRETILLDLRRVGSGRGIDRTLITRARTQLPDLGLLVGGGVAAPKELAELAALGVNGVLVATALHQGTIRARHLSEFNNWRYLAKPNPKTCEENFGKVKCFLRGLSVT